MHGYICEKALPVSDRANGSLEAMMMQGWWKGRLSATWRVAADESLAHTEVANITAELQRSGDPTARWRAARDCVLKWEKKVRLGGLSQFLHDLTDSVGAAARSVLQNFDTNIAAETKAQILWLQELAPAIAW